MSKHKKDVYRFESKDWEVRESSWGTATDIKKGYIVTKRKPPAELTWRNITPAGLGLLGSDYQLVQFYLEGLEDYEQCVYGNVIHLIPTPITDTAGSCYYPHSTVIQLYSDCINSWSAPVVIPIDFYNNLDKYVAAFNQTLNNGGTTAGRLEETYSWRCVTDD